MGFDKYYWSFGMNAIMNWRNMQNKDRNETAQSFLWVWESSRAQHRPDNVSVMAPHHYLRRALFTFSDSMSHRLLMTVLLTDDRVDDMYISAPRSCEVTEKLWTMWLLLVINWVAGCQNGRHTADTDTD